MVTIEERFKEEKMKEGEKAGTVKGCCRSKIKRTHVVTNEQRL